MPHTELSLEQCSVPREPRMTNINTYDNITGLIVQKKWEGNKRL